MAWQHVITELMMTQFTDTKGLVQNIFICSVSPVKI